MAQKIKLQIQNSNLSRIFVILFLLITLLFLTSTSYADSSYVLPYPSTMPGGIYYKLHLVEEALLKYWYFGDFGQFNYNLKESDKYLVEAKTLFEYNQYLLGFSALEKSDAYFTNTLPNLLKAQNKGENILADSKLLSEAAQKHIEVLTKLKQEIPANFTWSPEKSLPTRLNLKASIDNSIAIREKFL
ncbi:MAG TPA: hypothetical protein VMR59_04460 [Patescibacteria group bacterium]|nr:hypothetical protein [Patescibacteria group bacterium]